MQDSRPEDAIRTGEESTQDAVIAQLQGHMQHLRSIKDMELKWLDRFSAVTLPLAAYLFAVGSNNALLRGSAPVLLLVAVAFFTGWIQNVLRKERRSYFRVMRAVVRAQNYLGMFDINFVPEIMANSPFPKGLGPNPDVDGTQPYSSFLHRQVYTLIVLIAVALLTVFRRPDLSLCLAIIPLDVLWLYFVYRQDARDLRNEALAEKGLAGTEADWFPEEK